MLEWYATDEYHNPMLQHRPIHHQGTRQENAYLIVATCLNNGIVGSYSMLRPYLLL